MADFDDLLGNDNEALGRYCYCDELLLGEGRKRERVPIMKFHSCEYVRRRNALIPKACKIATERMSRTPNDDTKSRAVKWTRQFSIAMDELSEPLLQNGA